MSASPLIVPALLIASVLVFSAVAKLREPRATADAFVSLRLPGALTRLRAPVLLPYGEILLAAGLVLAPGRAYAVAAAAAVLLFGAYLAIIARALTFEDPVTCGCFGRLGLGTVSRWTVARNALLLLLAVLVLLDASGGVGVAARLADADARTWGWVAMVALGVTVAGLIAHVPGGSSRAGGVVAGEPLADYQRQVIPYGVLARPDGGTVSLRTLARQRAQLLLFVNPRCAPCVRVLADVGDFRARAPELDLWAVLQHGTTAAGLPDGVPHLSDPEGATAQLFGAGSPGAVLLGADGLLAGGPVIGEDDVRAFLSDILAELEAARAPASMPQGGSRRAATPLP